ncbi:AmmeMemoRadiSam system radical SAM enzyme [Patescibacteria group bacterium]|nr:AmmeMemoRadiSam system radical SAM enzyme [Patescibacteria group bacterium]
MEEAKLYKKSAGSQVQCQLCNHFCQFSENQTGICGVRQNQNGKLISLNYGRLITEAVDPIEKKPIFHLLPGSLSYSIATVGCNLRCDNCQNWQISQAPKSEHQFPGYGATSEEVIQRAVKLNCQSISYTYTEPTIFFEFALDCMRLARQKGLKNIWVSNGYMSKQCLDEILPYLNAINVDLKFFDEKIYLKNCGCKLEPILENLKYLSKQKVLLEVTTLLIPGATDLNGQPKKIAEFIAKELSKDVPWHISRFSPEISFNMQNGDATSDKLIDQVYRIGKEAGLKYIYVGNVWGDKRENTYCPRCQELIIERRGYQIKRYDKQGRCLKCNFVLPLKLS